MRRNHRWLAKVGVTTLVAMAASCLIASCQPEPSAPEADTPPTPPSEAPNPDRLPAAWSMDEIAEASPPYGQGPNGVYVLAWKVRDDNPQGGSCLVMRVLDEDDGHGRWHLTHLWRRPGAKWELSTMHASFPKGHKYWPGIWIHHSMRFKERPTNKDLDAAFADQVEGVAWKFEPDEGETLFDCGVCEGNWLRVTGEKPTRSFHRGGTEQ